MDISVVIPLLNEDESLPELTAWIGRVMLANDYTYEIIMIDDGSTDDSWNVINRLRNANGNIKGIKISTQLRKECCIERRF